MSQTIDPTGVAKRVELLAGAPSPAQSTTKAYRDTVCAEIGDLDALSIESLNRLLITSGFNRVSDGFFEFFQSLGGSFDDRLEQWRILCMRQFGNFRYPFRTLSRGEQADLVERLLPAPPDYQGRSRVRDRLRTIAREDLPMLGSIFGKEARLIERKREQEGSVSGSEEEYLERYSKAKKDGLHNVYEYASMEYLDVYVATSMRTPEDFYSINRFVGDLFETDYERMDLSKVSFFDPTQKYHDDRILTGLLEALMLRRAQCTVYLAQEQDTLGKDSELASTLAQGKPVIVYLPRIDDRDEFKRQVVDDLEMALRDQLGEDASGDAGESLFNRFADRFQKVLPDTWLEMEFADGIGDQNQFEEAIEAYVGRLAEVYDDRARKLHGHPLGIQVSIATGVPNGVLVTRTIDECRDLMVDALTNTMTFRIEARETVEDEPTADFTAPLDWDRLLIENRSDSIHRVVLGDVLVSNAYWNWFAVES